MSQADFFHELEETNIGLCKENLCDGILVELSFSNLGCSLLRGTGGMGGIFASLVKHCTWLAQRSGGRGSEVWWWSPKSPVALAPLCSDYGAIGGAHRLGFSFDTIYLV